VSAGGYYLDSDLSLYYLRARHYAPHLGSFLSREPWHSGWIDNERDKPSLNGFTYVGNNPINWSDPSGLQGVRPGNQEVNASHATTSMSLNCDQDCCPPDRKCTFVFSLGAKTRDGGNLGAGVSIVIKGSPGQIVLNPINGRRTITSDRTCQADIERADRLSYITIVLPTGTSCRFSSDVFAPGSSSTQLIDWSQLPAECRNIITGEPVLGPVAPGLGATQEGIKSLSENPCSS
jgi:RHS repeat-associated protein